MADDSPIEISPPDIARYRAGNAGIEHVFSFDSGKPGPHVALSAIVHGNELCGAIALDFLLREGLRPPQGRLSYIFCNVAAYLSFDPAQPSASRFIDEDFNRVWTPEVLDGSRSSVELSRARELRPLIDSVDFLLDIHSMQHATAPLLMVGPLEKGRDFAREIGTPETVVCDEGHAAGRRMRDYGGFGDKHSPKNALLVECGQHWERGSVPVAIETALAFLGRFAIIDDAFLARHRPRGPAGARRFAPQRVVEVTDAVTIGSDSFTFTQDFNGLEVIARQGTVIGHDGGEPVRTPYDNCVLVMPSRRLSKGQTAVRLGRYIA